MVKNKTSRPVLGEVNYVEPLVSRDAVARDMRSESRRLEKMQERLKKPGLDRKAREHLKAQVAKSKARVQSGAESFDRLTREMVGVGAGDRAGGGKSRAPMADTDAVVKASPAKSAATAKAVGAAKAAAKGASGVAPAPAAPARTPAVHRARARDTGAGL
ncbi:MAG: hypothetical protein M0Z85_12815 [Gammaproteobacteria bacterium]|nr:hypothetical protein [Gammaproteobacteria bacterium]